MAGDGEQFYEQLQKESNPQLQALGKEIQELVDDANTNDDKFDFNDILNSSFRIGQDTATKIIEDINNLMKENPKYNNNEDLMMVITYLQPFANPIDNYPMPQEDPAIGTEGNVDINRDLKKQIKEISNRITNILTKTPADQTELRHTLYSLQNILKDRNDINPREMDQIKRLINADNSITDKDVFSELSTFIKKIEGQVNNLKDYNELMNKYEQSQNKFNEFYKIITDNKLSLLDKFNNNEDLNKISFFIEHNPGNENILNLYLAMMNIKDSQGGRLSGNDIHGGDRGAFNNVLRILDNQYGEGKIYHEKVQLHFLDIKFEERLQDKTLIEFCEKTLQIPSWNGEDIREGEYETINNLCKSRGGKFTEEQFVGKFNDKNFERRLKNEENIINQINITQKLGGDIMEQIELDGENLQFKKDEEHCVDFDTSELQSLIKDLGNNFIISASEISGGEFIDEDQEIRKMIINDEFIAQARIQQIKDYKQHEAENPAADPEIEPIDNLEEDDIKVGVFKIEKNDIVSAINDAISKINDYADTDKNLYTERIQKVIDALKNPGNKVNGTGSTSIQELQNTMNETLEKHLKPDGKLGNKTLYVIKEYIGVLTKKEQLLHDRGELSFSAKQLEILRLIDEGKENDLKGLLSIPDDADINEFALNLLEKGKRREYLEAYIFNKNFPGKGEISGIINNKGPQKNLKKLQLQLIPYYKGHTDGLMGPLTLTAIETYVQKNNKEDDRENNNKIEIPEKDNANIVRLNNNNEAVTNNSDEINTVINKTKKHAYFLDGADFEYEKDANNPSTIMKITVKNTRDDKEETYTYTKDDQQNNGLGRITREGREYDSDSEKHLQFLKNAKTTFDKISQ